MKRYDYRLLTKDDRGWILPYVSVHPWQNVADALRELGQAGWRVAGVLHDHAVILERPIDDEKEKAADA